MRRHRSQHQGVGPGEQEPGGGAEAGGSRVRPGRAAAVSLPRLVRGRPDALRWLQRQPHPRVAGNVEYILLIYCFTVIHCAMQGVPGRGPLESPVSSQRSKKNNPWLG